MGLPYKEYAFEDGTSVDTTNMRSDLLPKEIYQQAHQALIIPCHDIFIEIDGGFLLVKRKDFPAKNSHFPIGGRMLRGMSTEESLRKKVKEECSLELEDITLLGQARTLFRTAPWNLPKGTDTINLIYLAKGKGQLQLNNLHEEPLIVTKANYPSIRPTLHPYVQDGLDCCFSTV